MEDYMILSAIVHNRIHQRMFASSKNACIVYETKVMYQIFYVLSDVLWHL